MLRHPLLHDRAAMFTKARSFFSERDIIEVDTPALSPHGAIDTHIDLIPAHLFCSKTYYLHSSPEYRMKALLVEGSGDIYQLSHVFRDNEKGDAHSVEFTMAEWYRCGFSFEEMIIETVDFAKLFIEDHPPVSRYTYRQALNLFAHIDPFTSNIDKLISCLTKAGIDNPVVTVGDQRDDLLNAIVSFVVEPYFDKGHITVLSHYPASQAACAQTAVVDGIETAERFELFYGGLELANGYHELVCPREQHNRFLQANEERRKLNKPLYPIDIHFLDALAKGLPDCCGVAVGFDRLMMARHNTSFIAEVLP
ncbi:EF-P lysine aminoacylase GenX [Simkania negevensis]|uniref:EF-P lysine aminoacylase GenX n=1 Tax=Simkania negevensis TaxID=83561 RepID=A0ABS3API3_9BACT|nr:EF-P lysine aminoacylase GenX [Simkania negevensis]